MRLQEKFDILRAHFQGWRTVDLREAAWLITPEHKRFITRENSRAVLDGRIKGFVLIHEDGKYEYYSKAKSARVLGEKKLPKDIFALSSFSARMPMLGNLRTA